MGHKRRYYREERRPIRYQDDYDDWDEDEDDYELDGDRVLKRGSMGILVVIVLGVALWAVQFVYTPSAQSALTGSYKIVSVSQGKLHTVEIATGRKVSFVDKDLVRKALRGDLRAGDVFYR